MLAAKDGQRWPKASGDQAPISSRITPARAAPGSVIEMTRRVVFMAPSFTGFADVIAGSRPPIVSGKTSLDAEHPPSQRRFESIRIRLSGRVCAPLFRGIQRSRAHLR